VKWQKVNSFVRTVPSPVNPSKHYHEYNIVYANSIDFGVRNANMSMIVMQTVQARGSIRVMLNLDRKELDIQFPLKLGNDTRRLRFRLPIALISHVYRVEDTDRSQTDLIIPFESAPQFFMQKYEGEDLGDRGRFTSFSHKEKSWIDWNTWFRETDVIDQGFRRTLDALPLMDPKGKATIDIGELYLFN
jgi:RNA-dependent RNA polymerase